MVYLVWYLDPDTYPKTEYPFDIQMSDQNNCKLTLQTSDQN